MRVFTVAVAFKPDSCKDDKIALETGKSYKILNSAKRKDPGIWILVEHDKVKYDVFLSDEEKELGIIERVKRNKR